jgi:hypothetical protein
LYRYSTGARKEQERLGDAHAGKVYPKLKCPNRANAVVGLYKSNPVYPYRLKVTRFQQPLKLVFAAGAAAAVDEAIIKVG